MSSISEKLISVILTLIFTLTGLSGSLLSSGVEQPVTLEIGIETGDPSLLGFSMGDETSDAVISELLSLLTLRLSADASAGQFQLKMNDTALTSLSVQKREGGWDVVSGLFPSTLLTVTDETLAAYTGAYTGSSNLSVSSESGSVDADLLASLSLPFTEVLESFKEKAGAAETGTFTVGGVTYTQKKPYDISMKEASVSLLSAVKSILSDETLSSLLSQVDESLSVESVEEALEDLESRDESELPALSVTEYADGAERSALEIRMEKDGESVTVLSAAAGQVTTVTVSAMELLNGTLVLDQENRKYDLDLTVTEDSTVQIKGSLSATDAGCDAVVAVQMDGSEMAFKVNVNFDAPVFEAGEDLSTVALEDLMTDQTAYSTFSAEVYKSVLTDLMPKVMTEFPGIVKLMIPSTTTTVEEDSSGSDPAGETVKEQPIEVSETVPAA